MLRTLILSFLAAGTAACGGFFCSPNTPVVQSGEAIVFGVADNNQDVSMHILINYEGPSNDFGWILPVMFEPTLETSSDMLFQGIRQQTAPTFQLSINRDASKTCASGWNEPECAFDSNVPPGGPDATGGGVEVEEGIVGPFDFAIIKAIDQDVDAVLGWLKTNNYDEYTGSADIINYYVKSEHYFVALRLNKDSDTGDIVPISIRYQKPADMDLIACVPLILTQVAATESMPINVYLLGQYDIDPVNFFKIELDDTQVDWLGCQNFGFTNAGCHDLDYRARAAAAFALTNDHAFIAEFAGDSSVLDGQIEVSIDETALGQTETPVEFLTELSNSNIPSMRLLDNILNEAIKADPTAATTFCDLPSSLFTWQLQNCEGSWKKSGDFDAVALASEIQTRIVKPSQLAQAFVSPFTRLTSYYVQMKQINMNKDPFFRFRTDGTTKDISNVHTATGVQNCDANNEVDSIEITLADGTTFTEKATFVCGVFFAADSTPPVARPNAVSMARSVIVPEFRDEAEIVLGRQEDGSFDDDAIATAAEMMDARVMNMTIVPMQNETTAPTMAPVQLEANVTESPTAPTMAPVTPAQNETVAPTMAPVQSEANVTESPVPVPTDSNKTIEPTMVPVSTPTASPEEATTEKPSSAWYQQGAGFTLVSMTITLCMFFSN